MERTATGCRSILTGFYISSELVKLTVTCDSLSMTAPIEADEAPTTPTWTDRKRYLWLLSMIVPLLPLLGWGLVNLTGLRLFWWFGPMFVYGLMPLIDILLGRDAENPPDSALAWLEQDRYYRWCTYLFLPLQYLSITWAMCGFLALFCNSDQRALGGTQKTLTAAYSSLSSSSRSRCASSLR